MSQRARYRRMNRKVREYRYLPQYLWTQKGKFGIRRTKFDISYCVFRESYVGDQYDIFRYLDRTAGTESLFFLDIGRNHGLVFYYAVEYILRRELPIHTIKYVGVDPSPLKFVYYDDFARLEAADLDISYRLIDRALVFDGEATADLHYGERNFGNFNVTGSNYAAKLASRQSKWSYIDIEVDTLQLSELEYIAMDGSTCESAIVKIDCKNETENIFLRFMELFAGRDDPYLVACERDSSALRDVSEYVRPGANVLSSERVEALRRPSVE